jgi:hypothetical protein
MKKPRLILVPDDAVLLTREAYQRIALATAQLNLPRRKIPDWMADRLYRDDVTFAYIGGALFIVTDNAIDEAFNEDGSFRWLSDLTRFADAPPSQAPQRRLLPRLRLLALAFAIERAVAPTRRAASPYPNATNSSADLGVQHATE